MSPPATAPQHHPILGAWQATLTARESQPAIFDAAGKVERTFGQIEQESIVAGETFAAVRPGEIVALQLGNGPQWPAALLALFRRGGIPLPLGRHMAEAELRLALETCQVARLVTLIAEGQLEVAALEPASTLTPPPRSFDFLKLTSGTTSAPRGVRFTAAQLVADCDQICATMGIGADDLNFGAIPVSHSYGFSNLLLPLLCHGVPLVLTEDRLPRAILEGLAATGVTVFPGMPVFFDKLAALANAPALPRLRLCISAGAPLTPAIGRAFTARYGVKVHTFYGSSECGGIAYDASAELVYEDGYVGSAMQGVALESAALPGETGRIQVRSAAVGEGYFPAEEPETLGGGQFTPGDLVLRTARGLYLTGRATDLINIAGRKLNPAEVEARLATFPGVRHAIVFGIPSTLRGEEPVACLVGEQLSRVELQRFCAEHLSQWQTPRDFWLLPELPANERGKVSRRQLAEQYLAQRSSVA